MTPSEADLKLREYFGEDYSYRIEIHSHYRICKIIKKTDPGIGFETIAQGESWEDCFSKLDKLMKRQK